MTQQNRPNGTLRHLLTLEGMSRQQMEALLTRAQKFVKPAGEPPAHKRTLAGITVANMFTEPSTRTRVSFELAAKRLG
ncbi:MAG TPA: aspartate carbamoyltransferase catalytic subunit, partial [Steroidobacteraceae bacterium]|nr:aspartate carbamoyltransferase catalytic subunit [Steroidobacteraceae bacterium]